MSLRAEVVETAREMLRLGLVTGTSGNVSGRAGERIEITPSDLPYEHMTETDLVTLAADGSVVAGHREPSSEYRVHVAVYAARPGRARDRPHPQRPRHRLEPARGAARHRHRGARAPGRRGGPDRRLRPHRLG